MTEQMVQLNGNTYPLKDEIKQAGGKWDAKLKMWFVPQSKFEELQTKLSTAPKPFSSNKRCEGQLWEECPRCGREPVYMSLDGMCERCG